MTSSSLPRVAVLIGRFEPPHRAHLQLMLEALEGGRDLVVVLGSARSARTVRNPLGDAQREALIRGMLEGAGVPRGRVRVEAVPDAYYFLASWVERVRAAVGTAHATLAGFEKDASSFYLRLFPEWTFTPPRFVSRLNATDVREAMYGGRWDDVARDVPPQVLAGLREFAGTPEFTDLLADRRALHVLAGAGPRRTRGVVLRHGPEVLLAVRDERPGLGLHAIPEADTAGRAAAAVTDDPALTSDVLAGSAVRARTLDNPQRVPGVDWVTHATLHDLPFRPDARPGAAWVDVETLTREPWTYFADHAQGVRALLEDWPA